MLEPVKNNNKKEPIRENGIQVITISENLGDSNCIAITKNTRNTAVKIDFKIDINSSYIISVCILFAGVTPSGKSMSATSSSMASCASKRRSDVVVAVTAA